MNPSVEVSDALEGADFTPVYFSNRPHDDDPEKPLHGYSEATQDLDYSLPVPIHSGQHALRTIDVRDDSGNSIYSDSHRLPIQLSSSAPLESEMASVRRISTFSQISRISRAFKKFSMYASSASVKSMRRERDTMPINGGAHLPIPALPRLSGFKDPGPFADPLPSFPSPSALSSVSSNLANSAADGQSISPFTRD